MCLYVGNGVYGGGKDAVGVPFYRYRRGWSCDAMAVVGRQTMMDSVAEKWLSWCW